MADALLIVGFIAFFALLGIIGYYYIYPDFRKASSGYQSVPQFRNARSIIFDRHKNKFGWGQIKGKRMIGVDKVLLHVSTPNGEMSVPYDRHEIQQTDVFDGVGGTGPQVYIIKDPHTPEPTPQEAYMSIQRRWLEENKEKVMLENNVNRALDKRLDDVKAMVEARKPKQTTMHEA